MKPCRRGDAKPAEDRSRTHAAAGIASESMRLLVDDRWIGSHGIGRFARETLARLPVTSTMPAGLGPGHPLDPAWTAVQLLRLRPDVYFEPGYNPPLATRVPFVFTLHDLIHLRFAAESDAAKRLYYERVVRPAAHRAHRVLTVSEFSKGEIVAWARLAPERVVVVGNGVAPHFCPDGERLVLDKPYVLYVGNRRPHKNVRALVLAFARSGRAREVVLLLTGERDLEARRWMDEAGLDETQVRFAGTVAESRLPACYRGAMALAIPSLYEGFGLPALEAMACGTPVLAARGTSLPEVVGDAGLLVDAQSIDALSDGLRALVDDATLRATLAARGLAHASGSGWGGPAQRVLAVLTSALESRR